MGGAALQLIPASGADKTEAVACRDVDGPPSNRSAALDVARKGGIAPPTAALDAARKNGIFAPINGSAAFDVARKEGIAPPTAALDAARRSGVWYTHGPPIDSGGERAVKTEAVACRDVDGPSSNRSAALDVARKGSIAPPTAALDAARKNGILYIWTSN
ncbi:hypothetical protein B0H14DRAFT_3475363 [Mycena olivaceomarginata]|nr:hypothetical protein B0H14DRAFT_3475363 [Mycena olivaceomarginata]